MAPKPAAERIEYESDCHAIYAQALCESAQCSGCTMANEQAFPELEGNLGSQRARFAENSGVASSVDRISRVRLDISRS